MLSSLSPSLNCAKVIYVFLAVENVITVIRITCFFPGILVYALLAQSVQMADYNVTHQRI